MAHPLRSVLRAAVGGLVLGLFGASLVLLFAAVGNARHECEFPDTEECNFELQEAHEIGRLQAFAAIGCSLISGGIYLAARRS